MYDLFKLFYKCFKNFGGLFDFIVSLNQTNWFRVFVERLSFGFRLDNNQMQASVPLCRLLVSEKKTFVFSFLLI